MANATGILSATTAGMATPAVARRTWPRWAALGVAMIAVAVVAVAWEAAGARLLLGALGLFLAVRGALLLRGAGVVEPELAARARPLGTAAVVAGIAGQVVALVSASSSATVLLVGVPLALLVASAGLLARGGTARRGGQALLVWSLLVTALLVVTGLAQGWDRAEGLATVVAALGVAVLGLPLLIGAANLRTIGAQPDPAPVRSGCGGCACGAGGCGS
ncbi:hypothetical protein DQ237_03580 [Blastococcus sp. TF02-8]|uniref:hypothetical protein n=1 Tax=Blastococcus sp. TF02-8 TaxID=2250574 RepID=UPI000DEB706C|nr:hypothetical protein [Blastococcus sp. TF02-8]RBY97986.1 hypothetical protein DQ237_03580 [Blastococcus sp. TF02-8]